MEKVTIVFSSSDYYSMLLGVVLCSLFENKKGDYPIEVYVIDAGISAANKKRLGTLEKRYGFVIHYVVPDKQLLKDLPIEVLSKHYHMPMEIYYRIAIARLLPVTCHKLLYLDVDVVVRGDIAEFFNVDLSEKIIGAVGDCYPDERRKHLRDLCKVVHVPEMPKDFFYFNSGALLVNLDLWRRHGIEKKLFAVIHENPDKLLYHDQDALNIVLLNDCKELPLKYNLVAAGILEGAYRHNEPNPLIVHFAGGGKAWYVLSALPYQSEYVYYANKTPWRNKKYRKLMDVYFAKKYHIYAATWRVWGAYKKIRKYFGA